MSALRGICLNCRAHYDGWALRNYPAQKCIYCGNDLKIVESGIHIRSHYSSLSTKTYKAMYPILHEKK